MPVPNALLGLAALSCGIHLFGRIGRSLFYASTWMKSFFNGNRYLLPVADKTSSSSPLAQQNGSGQKAFAVIYGAGNKAGKAFAFYLYEKGYNLIMIERDAESLLAVEELLEKMLPQRNGVIEKIVMNKFDQASITKAIGNYASFPVKVFVNCKSSK
mmetsp:Transcript_34712/g.53270  ORF Transcript_34712/g.53270 Transcript_34712/m.53270 type:complete len:157 (+) Transcript_34712:94-564(+)